MKSLIDFIKESKEEKPSSKTLTFNFNGIDNVEEIIKLLSEDDTLDIEDNKVTVTINADNVGESETDLEKLENIIKGEREGTHSSNNEQYSQLVSALERTLQEAKDFITSLTQPEEEDDDKKDDKKNDKKDE